MKLYASVNPAAARIHFIENSLQNPPAPASLLYASEKTYSGSWRVTDVAQVGSERIIEISLETLNELGFTVSKKLIFEIMGKHSNIVLLDISSGKIIDCIKHVSIDVNRVRQLLPGIIYKYPPAQDKIPFKELLPEGSPSVFLPPEAKAIQQNGGRRFSLFCSGDGSVRRPSILSPLCGKDHRRRAFLPCRLQR